MSGLVLLVYYNILLLEFDLDFELKVCFFFYLKCVNNLECFKDYYEGVIYVKEINKFVFLDFIGYGCVNCWKMEEYIWIVEFIWECIMEDYVLIFLYVDDRNLLDKFLVFKVSNKKF